MSYKFRVLLTHTCFLFLSSPYQALFRIVFDALADKMGLCSGFQAHISQ